MEITRLALNDKQVKLLLPTDLWGYPAIEGTLLFGAFEGADMKALALLVKDISGMNTYMLKYISYGKNLRAARELIAYMADFMRRNGARYFAAQMIGDEGYAAYAHELLLGEGFTPVSVNGHHLMYFMQDIKEILKTDSAYILGENYRRNIKDYETVDRKKLETFKNRLKADNENLLFPSQAKEYTLFYEEKDEISAFVSFVNFDNKILCFLNSYHRGEDAGKVILLMSVELLLKAAGSMDEDAAFIVATNRDNIYRGIISTLGEAERDCLVNEYVMALR